LATGVEVDERALRLTSVSTGRARLLPSHCKFGSTENQERE
jgi:hypothetical protein